MLTYRTVLQLLRPEALRDLLSLLLLLALLPLGDVMAMVALGSVVGICLVLAVAATTTLVGVLVAVAEVRVEIAALRRGVASGDPEGGELASIAGLLAAALLLLCPGLATNLAGLVLLSPRPRRRVGASVLSRLGIDAKAIHEYLKLSAAEEADAPEAPEDATPSAGGSTGSGARTPGG